MRSRDGNKESNIREQVAYLTKRRERSETCLFLTVVLQNRVGYAILPSLEAQVPDQVQGRSPAADKLNLLA